MLSHEFRQTRQFTECVCVHAHVRLEGLSVQMAYSLDTWVFNNSPFEKCHSSASN